MLPTDPSPPPPASPSPPVPPALGRPAPWWFRLVVLAGAQAVMVAALHRTTTSSLLTEADIRLDRGGTATLALYALLTCPPLVVAAVAWSRRAVVVAAVVQVLSPLCLLAFRNDLRFSMLAWWGLLPAWAAVLVGLDRATQGEAVRRRQRPVRDRLPWPAPGPAAAAAVAAGSVVVGTALAWVVVAAGPADLDGWAASPLGVVWLGLPALAWVAGRVAPRGASWWGWLVVAPSVAALVVLRPPFDGRPLLPRELEPVMWPWLAVGAVALGGWCATAAALGRAATLRPDPPAAPPPAAAAS